MKILRQIGKYSLVKNSDSESKSLKYYIDNGEDCTEYFDKYDKDELMEMNDQDFKKECKSYF